VSPEEQALAMMAELNANTRKSFDASMRFVDEATSAMHRKAARITKQRAGTKAKPTAPIARELHGYAQIIANHVDAIAARLEPSERERVLAVMPGFLRAITASEPDVVTLVQALLQATPETVALWLRANLELIERRFAS